VYWVLRTKKDWGSGTGREKARYESGRHGGMAMGREGGARRGQIYIGSPNNFPRSWDFAASSQLGKERLGVLSQENQWPCLVAMGGQVGDDKSLG